MLLYKKSSDKDFQASKDNKNQEVVND